MIPMKKALAALVVFVSLFFNATAQSRISIVSGIHSASVKEDNNLPGWDTLKNNYSSRTGFHIGFIADIPLSATSGFYFQPGILFYNKGRKFFTIYDTTVNSVWTVNASQFTNYIDIPLNLVFKKQFSKKNKLMIGAGPYLSFFYSGTEKTETYYADGKFKSEENKDLPVGSGAGQYNTFNFGVNGLLGMEFGRIFLTANYSRGLNNFFHATGYEGTFKHQVIGATLGVFFGPSRPPEVKLKDNDRDGIPDVQDDCPTIKGGTATRGCPDKDADGIPDKDDRCPDTPGLQKYNGCPVPDSDGDGLNDEIDKCPNVAGLNKYEGCPIPDADKDGINDEEDKCPELFGIKKYDGCPIPDRDHDGVADDSDKCPDTPGSTENEGCPEIKKEIIQKVDLAASKIQFQYNRAALTTESYTVLDDVVKLLKENPELNIHVEGHTSSEGAISFNMKLSLERANIVKRYLETKGVESTRLKAEGFGSTKLLNSDKTPAEKALNRRVELKLSNQ